MIFVALTVKRASKDLSIKKVRIAKKVTEYEANLDVLDLKKNISKLVKFINHSNG